MVSRILKLRFFHETKFVYLFSCTVIVNNNIQFRGKKWLKFFWLVSKIVVCTKPSLYLAYNVAIYDTIQMHKKGRNYLWCSITTLLIYTCNLTDLFSNVICYNILTTRYYVITTRIPFCNTVKHISEPNKPILLVFWTAQKNTCVK